MTSSTTKYIPLDRKHSANPLSSKSLLGVEMQLNKLTSARFSKSVIARRLLMKIDHYSIRGAKATSKSTPSVSPLTVTYQLLHMSSLDFPSDTSGPPSLLIIYQRFVSVWSTTWLFADGHREYRTIKALGEADIFQRDLHTTVNDERTAGKCLSTLSNERY